jgi:hypothetical protein
MGIVALAGCQTAPPSPPETPPPPIAKPAPRFEGASIPFQEVVVSVPVEGAHQVYQNLHVGLMAAITTHDTAVGDPSAVKALAVRLEPQVAAEILKALTDSPTLSPHKLDQVRDNLAAKIQPVVDQTLAAWPPAAQYDVKVVIVSMYWTDSTVGRRDLSGKSKED